MLLPKLHKGTKETSQRSNAGETCYNYTVDSVWLRWYDVRKSAKGFTDPQITVPWVYKISAEGYQVGTKG